MTQQEMDTFVQLIANTLNQLNVNDLTGSRASVVVITEWIRTNYPHIPL